MSELNKRFFLTIDGKPIYSQGPQRVEVTCNVPNAINMAHVVKLALKSVLDELNEADIEANLIQASFKVTDSIPHYNGEWKLTIEKTS